MKKKAVAKTVAKKSKPSKAKVKVVKAADETPAPVEAKPNDGDKLPKKRGPHGPRQPKEPSAASKIHVGEIVSRRMRMCNLNKNRLATILKLTPPTVSMMVNSRSIQTERLMELSFVLKHNFFLEIGQLLQLSEAGSKAMEAAALHFQNDTDQELKFLREENAYLRRIVEIMAANKN